MTELYCVVDDFLKTHPGLAQWRRSPHAQPHFSDAEVLTIALLQGAFDVATLKQTLSAGRPELEDSLSPAGVLQAMGDACAPFAAPDQQVAGHDLYPSGASGPLVSDRQQTYSPLPTYPSWAGTVAARGRGLLWEKQQRMVLWFQTPSAPPH